MPAETHQLGRQVAARDVLDLLEALLDSAGDAQGSSTLVSLGVDEEAPSALWGAVCEEFAERTIGPELEPGTLEVTMTLEEVARTMARLLSETIDDAS
jgi:hypothetical protein